MLVMSGKARKGRRRKERPGCSSNMLNQEGEKGVAERRAYSLATHRSFLQYKHKSAITLTIVSEIKLFEVPRRGKYDCELRGSKERPSTLL